MDPLDSQEIVKAWTKTCLCVYEYRRRVLRFVREPVHESEASRYSQWMIMNMSIELRFNGLALELSSTFRGRGSGELFCARRL